MKQFFLERRCQWSKLCVNCKSRKGKSTFIFTACVGFVKNTNRLQKTKVFVVIMIQRLTFDTYGFPDLESFVGQKQLRLNRSLMSHLAYFPLLFQNEE